MRYVLTIRSGSMLIDKILGDSFYSLKRIIKRYRSDTGSRYDYLIYDNNTKEYTHG